MVRYALALRKRPVAALRSPTVVARGLGEQASRCRASRSSATTNGYRQRGSEWQTVISVERFLEIRPWVYHLTAGENRPGIRTTRQLLPAAAFLVHRSTATVRERRADSISIATPQGMVLIRDQAPLHPGHIELQRGFSLEDLIELLNRHVFFWPGTAAGPSRYGQNHFGRYADSAPVLLRFPTHHLFDRYPDAVRFCRYNSGAPRTSYRRRSPRGPDLFLPPARFSGTPSKVVEVAVPMAVELPEATEQATHPAGPWTPFTRHIPRSP